MGWLHIVRNRTDTYRCLSVQSNSTQSGIKLDCATFYTVVKDDSCPKIQEQFSITFDQLFEWNPAINSQCKNLLVGWDVSVAVS